MMMLPRGLTWNEDVPWLWSVAGPQHCCMAAHSTTKKDSSITQGPTPLLSRHFGTPCVSEPSDFLPSGSAMEWKQQLSSPPGSFSQSVPPHLPQVCAQQAAPFAKPYLRTATG